jgi:hypothetical protein
MKWWSRRQPNKSLQPAIDKGFGIPNFENAPKNAPKLFVLPWHGVYLTPAGGSTESRSGQFFKVAYTWGRVESL